ncbi:MAG TPA: CoB--CoM heterodisulfide reductase iron-sulfur subunit B family protein [Thermodesulfobacteriota bacterium]|nr:CoB--CoM heterodisulfide reductase iron-sulfur subunit B family protein [Thermodesulfobacteriota bacterium]
MKEFAIFWGCTIQARFPFLEKSIRTVMTGMNIPYRDIDGFTCCPEKSLVNNIDHGLWLATGARNISIAEKEGLDIISPCTGCASNLATVKGELTVDPGKKNKVNSLLKEIGREFKGSAGLHHLIPFFHDEVGIHRIKSGMKRDFKGMRVAVHYGCHMMRPSHALKNDDPLEPKKFDNLVRALGAESLNYSTKLLCCGQGLDRVDQHEAALQMARVKLRELKTMGADAMVLCCPSCFLQFDNNQYLMEKEGERFGIPVLYFTDMLGLAMGYTPEELGFDGHRIAIGPFLKKWQEMMERPSRSQFEEEIVKEGALV